MVSDTGKQLTSGTERVNDTKDAIYLSRRIPMQTERVRLIYGDRSALQWLAIMGAQAA
jgi:hypothetical protein